MTLSPFSHTLLRRAPLIAGVLVLSLLSGAGLFYARPSLYEVSMILEVRSDALKRYSQPLPAIVRHLVESGALEGKIAEKAGLEKGETPPSLKAGVGFHSRLVKIYAFVPLDRMETAKTVFSFLPEVLNEEFPQKNAAYFQRISDLNSGLIRVRELKAGVDRELKRVELSREQKDLAGRLSDLAGDMSDMLEAAEALRADSQTLNAFDFRIVVPLSVSDMPAGPSLRQIMIAFALLGLFAGLAAALWAEERGGKGKAG